MGMIVTENAVLADVLWYKIGGKAKYLLTVLNRNDLFEALEFVKKERIENVFLCGLGSNLIFTDEFFNGAVIQIRQESNEVTYTEPNLLTAFAGQTLDSVILSAFDNGLIGLEWAGGLPGTIGAAVRGNVGAFGREMKDVVIEAEVLTREDGEYDVVTMSNTDLAFSYRNSLIKEQNMMIVVSATCKLRQGTDEELKKAQETYEANKQYRKEHHPLDYPNCGSVFKNISRNDQVEKIISVWPDIREQVETKWHGKVSMGYIIKKLGMSGYTIGRAQVSEKHANFIVNLGGAKAANVKQIISEIQNKFVQTFGFAPEVEIEIVSLTNNNLSV